MSMDYWGIVMYGVTESELKPGDKTFFEILEENDFYRSYPVTIDDDRVVILTVEDTNDETYIGYTARYPWNVAGTPDAALTEKDIEKAIAKFLEPHGYDPDDVMRSCCEINTINYG